MWCAIPDFRRTPQPSEKLPSMSTAKETRRAVQRLLGEDDDGWFGIHSQAAYNALKDAPAASVWPPIKEAAPAPLPTGTEFDARTERNLATLDPKAGPKFRAFMAKLIPFMAAKGVVAEVISGNRTYAEQDALYAQGRTKPGSIVTNAKGGQSNHNFRIAVDIGLFRDGDYLEDSPLYSECGPIGKSVGLEWGGDWNSIKDLPHFEIPTGLTMAEKRARMAASGSVL
jgi:peptidoglycan L-alanyl-D-glutamate endopeptidase CwlK